MHHGKTGSETLAIFNSGISNFNCYAWPFDNSHIF